MFNYSLNMAANMHLYDVQTEGKKLLEEEENDTKKRKYWRVDCQSASKGRN